MDRHPVENRHPCTDPNVIFYDDASPVEIGLLNDGHIQPAVVVVSASHDIGIGSDDHFIPDFDLFLRMNEAVLGDVCVIPYLDISPFTAQDIVPADDYLIPDGDSPSIHSFGVEYHIVVHHDLIPDGDLRRVPDHHVSPECRPSPHVPHHPGKRHLT